jgi:hypothetical protein
MKSRPGVKVCLEASATLQPPPLPMKSHPSAVSLEASATLQHPPLPMKSRPPSAVCLEAGTTLPLRHPRAARTLPGARPQATGHPPTVGVPAAASFAGQPTPATQATTQTATTRAVSAAAAAYSTGGSGRATTPRWTPASSRPESMSWVPR